MAFGRNKDVETKEDKSPDDLLAFWDDEYKDTTPQVITTEELFSPDYYDDEATKKKKAKQKKKEEKQGKKEPKAQKKEKKQSKVEKDPIFISKRTWKKLILLMFIIVGIAGSVMAVSKVNENIEATKEVEVNTNYSNMPDSYEFGKGEYKCGKDFKPGFYYIECGSGAVLTEVQIKYGELLKKAKNLGSVPGETGFNFQIDFGMVLKTDGYITLDWISKSE